MEHKDEILKALEAFGNMTINELDVSFGSHISFPNILNALNQLEREKQVNIIKHRYGIGHNMVILKNNQRMER